MSQPASSRRSAVLGVLFAVAVAAVVAFALFRLGGDDTAAQPAATRPATTTSAPALAPTGTVEAQPTAKPTPTATASCEGPDTQFNVEGTAQDSLLPDCGAAAPVTTEQEKKDGLGLGCGGAYPVILYKTTTSGAKTSICGKDASGETFRLVTQPDDGTTVDLPGSYDPQLDAFVASAKGTSYVVQAYSGALLVKKDGTTTKQPSLDWISLDNESDYD